MYSLKKWTKEKIFKEAKRFNTKKDWLSKSRKSYAAAKYLLCFVISIFNQESECLN